MKRNEDTKVVCVTQEDHEYIEELYRKIIVPLAFAR